MIYLILLAALIVFGGLMALFCFVLNKKLPYFQHVLMYKVMPIVIFVLLFASLMCFIDPKMEGAIQDAGTYASFGGPLSPFKNTIGMLAIWVWITASTFLILRPGAGFKTAKWYTKFIALPMLIYSAISLKPMLMMMQGNDNKSVLYFILPITIAIEIAYAAYFFITDFKTKIHKHSYGEVAVFSVLINLFTMPPYLPYFFFGKGNAYHHVIDLSIYHRLFLYVLLIIVPLAIYFSLRNAHPDKIRYSLIFIAFGTMFNFLANYDYRSFFQVWDWPFHICNTAMFIIPICYVFKPKRLFYFTYFINVFGALLAALMPDYSESLCVFRPSVIHFWVNHSCAFYMPLLGVALKMFDRPKLKQYFYSSTWFLIYFALVLTLNTLFTALDGTPVHTFLGDFKVSRTDYFFINSTFIADKLGNWAKQLFDITLKFNIKGKTAELHLVYQLIYFFTYVLMGFGVWFIYQLGFDIADSHYDLHLRLKGIRADRIALASLLNGRRIDQPMEQDAGIKLELRAFSKKYGANKHYSVHNANLTVEGGEVFGFLGPNGAGKSTIIKSIVGIQPITEGEIFVCGYNVKSQPVYSKSKIGFVPDHYALYEKLTGREYLNYIADIYEVNQEDRDARLKEYIELFELTESIDNKIKTYSHGMKQKITIIAALVHDPKVWILDEPLTGLDPNSIYQVKECMRRHAAAGNIVFFSSHLIDIVEKLCDKIAIIKKGEIQCIKTVSEIEQSGVSLEDFYMQTIGDNIKKQD